MGNIFDMFRKKDEGGEEKITVNLKLKIFVNKPEPGKNTPTPPMIILTKKKAEKLKQALSEVISNSKDYVRINLVGEINPDKDKGKDYSFLAIEELKSDK
jgi:hypothetical protein